MGNTNSILEMRIFLCGYYDLNILDNFLGKDFKKKTIDSSSSKVIKKELGWEYMLLNDGSSFNGDNLYKYVFDKIKKIILSKDIKNKKNLVIYIIKSVEEAKGMLSNFINENNQYHPIFLFVCLDSSSTKIENNIYNYIKGTKLSKNNVILVNYDGKNILPILQNILQVCSYYNELGDEFVFPPTACPEDIKLNVAKYEATFNSMVIGKPGVGKSSFINKILQANKCRTGVGFSVTSKITKYIHDKYPIIFYDVPGFEKAKDLRQVIKEIKKLGKYMKEASTKIDIIFYLINKESARTFFKEEVDELLTYLDNLNIPIFFVVTKSRSKESGEDFKETVKINLRQSFHENTCLIKNIYYIEMVEKKFGLEEMFQGIYNIYKNSLLGEEDFNNILPEDKEYNKKIVEVLKKSKFFDHYNSYDDLLKKCYHLGLAITAGASIAAFAIGAFSIPFSDAPLLCGLEISLIISIASCYGIRIDKAEAKHYLATFAATTGVAGFGMVIGKLKILPGIGIAFAGLEGVISGTCVGSIGLAVNQIFFDKAKSKDFKEIVLSHMKCYREALNYMKNFKD